MKRPPLSLICTLALGVLAPGALSAQIDATRVPAASKWVVYADIDGMRNSVLGQELIARFQEQKPMGAESPVQPDMARILETVGNVTAFGDNLADDPEKMDGALLLEGSDKLSTIAEAYIAHTMVTAPEQIEEMANLPFEAYRIAGEVLVGFPEEPVIVVSRSAARLQEALAAYRQDVPSLARAEGPLSHLMPGESDYYLFAGSVVPADAVSGGENSPQARVLKMARSVAVRVGEVDENVTASAVLTAEDDASAERLAKIVNGLVAILSLAQSEDAELVNFINSVKVERNDRQVGLTMAYASRSLIGMIEANLHREQVEEARREEAQAAAFTVEGDLVVEWRADAEIGGPLPDATNFTTHDAGVVTLRPGDRLIVSAQLDEMEAGRLDYIELAPAAQPAAVQRIEAEYLNLRGMSVRDSEHASGGALARVDDGGGQMGSAQLIFTGMPGDYRLTVGYVDENDGHAHFKVSVVRAGAAEAAPGDA